MNYALGLDIAKVKEAGLLPFVHHVTNQDLEDVFCPSKDSKSMGDFQDEVNEAQGVFSTLVENLRANAVEDKRLPEEIDHLLWELLRKKQEEELLRKLNEPINKLSKFPVEVLDHIFNFLPVHHWSTVKLTCKQWYQVIVEYRGKPDLEQFLTEGIKIILGLNFPNSAQRQPDSALFPISKLMKMLGITEPEDLAVLHIMMVFRFALGSKRCAELYHHVLDQMLEKESLEYIVIPYHCLWAMLHDAAYCGVKSPMEMLVDATVPRWHGVVLHHLLLPSPAPSCDPCGYLYIRSSIPIAQLSTTLLKEFAPSPIDSAYIDASQFAGRMQKTAFDVASGKTLVAIDGGVAWRAQEAEYDTGMKDAVGNIIWATPLSRHPIIVANYTLKLDSKPLFIINLPISGPLIRRLHNGACQSGSVRDGTPNTHGEAEIGQLMIQPCVNVLQDKFLFWCKANYESISLRGWFGLQKILNSVMAKLNFVKTVDLSNLPFLQSIGNNFLSESPCLERVQVVNTPCLDSIGFGFCRSCVKLQEVVIDNAGIVLDAFLDEIENGIRTSIGKDKHDPLFHECKELLPENCKSDLAQKLPKM